jgi:hypothetical protein
MWIQNVALKWGKRRGEEGRRKDPKIKVSREVRYF